MNVLTQYVNDNLDEILEIDPWHINTKYTLRETTDDIIRKTYILFEGSEQYRRLHNAFWLFFMWESEHWAASLKQGYLDWIPQVVPHELESEFSEHDLIELFMELPC